MLFRYVTDVVFQGPWDRLPGLPDVWSEPSDFHPTAIHHMEKGYTMVPVIHRFVTVEPSNLDDGMSSMGFSI